MKIRVLILLAVWALGPGAWHATAGSPPQSILPLSLLNIDSIDNDGTNVVVLVSVSADFQKVTLESKSRLTGTWEPIAVQRPGVFSTQVKQITFRLPRSEKMELLRVRGDQTEALPSDFYKGTNSFGVPTGSSGPVAGAGTGGADAALPPGGSKDQSPAPATDDNTRTVVESDIWNVAGDILYFFNQYRGLQVIDISKPDVPVVSGTFSLPAAGEQMYLLDTNHIVLLAQDNCSGWGTGAASQIVLIEVVNGTPKSPAALSVSGTIRESRMVGSALYVVSEYYRPIHIDGDANTKPQDVWEWGSQVTSYDLSDFADPKSKSSEWVSGYGNVIMATDRFLFVANQYYGTSASMDRADVHVFDISSPDGTMNPLSTISVAGRVKDKFKMNVSSDVFTVVTENWGDSLKTQVQTFSLTNPSKPAALGKMTIMEREQLYATRFDGDLLYAVTYLQKDPLWVIDLHDPANPQKVGQLDIPGWSTFLQPLDGKLLAIGIDNTNGWQTSVQLFDVKNPAKPSLLSKVLLGERNSYSEANYDEKAFGVFPDQNLVLVPYSSWDNNQYVQAVQLIDLGEDSLRKRGSINHTFEARRAAVHKDRILSLSATELLSVNATDRDQPQVTGSIELSWSADKVFVAGDYLVSLAYNSYSADSKPSIRVTQANSPMTVLNRLDLKDVSVIGTAMQNRQLYVLQGKSTEIIWPETWNETNYFPLATNNASLLLSVYDLSSLPELKLAGQIETTFDATKYWGNFKALWPKDNLLVWTPGRQSYLPWAVYDAMAGVKAGGSAGVAPAADIGIGIVGPIWRWGWGGNDFVAYNVGDSAKPAFASDVTLDGGTNGWWGFGDAFADGGLVYASHQSSVYLADVKPPPAVYQKWDGNEWIYVTNDVPAGSWVQKYYVDVINYGNPEDPSVRKPVNIPGSLVGIAKGGNMLFTQSSRYQDPATWSGWQEFLDASAYDGVEAHLVDSMTLPTDWPHPLLVQGENVFLGNPSEKSDVSSTLEVWRLSDSGKWSLAGSSSLKAAAQDLEAYGNLLATPLSVNNTIQLFDISTPASPRLLSVGEIEGCLGFDLTNADGNPEQGLWVPLGMYGISKLPANQ